MQAFKSAGYVTDKSFFAGTSGGSLGSLLACTDIDPELALDFVVRLSKDNDFKRDIDLGLKKNVKSLLPADAHRRCEDRLFVTTTRLWPNPSIQPTIISKFRSVDALVDAVAASCFIPMYSATRFTTSVTDHSGYYLDGGVFAFMPPIGEITMTPFPNKLVKPFCRRPHVSLDSSPYSVAQLLRWALFPPEARILR